MRLNAAGHLNVQLLLLRIKVFASGAVVMALEILGSRILAPNYGNSIFVWGSLIGVVLTGLSLGYHLGGRLADRSPSFKIFSAIIFSAGLNIILIPFISSPILEASLILGSGERFGPLFATTIILAPPSVVLGMVSPYAVKLATVSISGLGKVAGNLYALSTVGSIVGTFLTVFVLIPTFDLRSIVFALGLVLMASSIAGIGRIGILLFIVVLATVVSPLSGALLGLYVHMGDVVYEKETPYNHLDVVDRGSVRTLYLNGLPHSAMYLNDSSNLVFPYTRLFHLARFFKSEFDEVLFVGGGGFSGPKSFLESYPDVNIDVVEIDPVVIGVAYEYFSVESNRRLQVFNDDARNLLLNREKRYDVIVLDAYSKTYIPFHLMTREFFYLLRDRLTEDGVVVSNVIASLAGDASDILRAQYKTISNVFPTTYIFPVSSELGAVQNLIVIALKGDAGSRKEELARIAPRPDVPYSAEFVKYVSMICTGEDLNLEEATILTDNYAPVEHLLNPVTGRPYSPKGEAATERLPLISHSSPIAFTILVSVGLIWCATLLGYRNVRH